jgi:uncharacterized protein (TIGR00725 family)
VALSIPRRPSRETIYIAVVGPGDDATKEETDMARQVGRLLADRHAILVCGGLAGVMAAACEGASDGGGLTVGLLPGDDRAAGNPHLSVVLPTGIGELRNGLVVSVCDAVIAIGGGWGTLSEIALAIRTGKPTIMIRSWKVEDPVHARGRDLYPEVDSAVQAVNDALQLALERSRKRWWRKQRTRRSHTTGSRPAVEQPDTSRIKPRAPRNPNTDPKLQTGAPLADLWHAYERAQQHYEHDLELFSTRMSLFLVVQSALIALLASAIRLDKLSVADRHAVAIFGLALTSGWLLVASSSYMWVKTWRAHMIVLGKSLDEIVSVDISTKSFERKARKDIEREARKAQAADAFSERRVRDRFWKILEWFSWYVRPTLVICCLPVLFIGGWAYLGWWF